MTKIPIALSISASSSQLTSTCSKLKKLWSARTHIYKEEEEEGRTGAGSGFLGWGFLSVTGVDGKEEIFGVASSSSDEISEDEAAGGSSRCDERFEPIWEINGFVLKLGFVTLFRERKKEFWPFGSDDSWQVRDENAKASEIRIRSVNER